MRVCVCMCEGGEKEARNGRRLGRWANICRALAEEVRRALGRVKEEACNDGVRRKGGSGDTLDFKYLEYNKVRINSVIVSNLLNLTILR